MADIAASVLARLKNKTKASGISYQQYLDEDDYEVEFEEAGEQLDEIDTIFANP